MAYELSPEKRKKIEKARKQEEAKWRSKNGPVAVRRDPTIIKRKSE